MQHCYIVVRIIYLIVFDVVNKLQKCWSCDTAAAEGGSWERTGAGKQSTEHGRRCRWQQWEQFRCG